MITITTPIPSAAADPDFAAIKRRQQAAVDAAAVDGLPVRAGAVVAHVAAEGVEQFSVGFDKYPPGAVVVRNAAFVDLRALCGDGHRVQLVHVDGQRGRNLRPGGAVGGLG